MAVSAWPAGLPIPISPLAGWATFSKPTWSVPDTCRDREVLIGSIPSTPSMSLLRRLQPASSPINGRPRSAAIESFNGLWYKRVLVHVCADLRALRRTSDRFLCHHHFQKPIRSLSLAEHGARFPGGLRDRLWPSLRHLQEDFSIEHYIDAHGHLALPIAKGHVSWVRKVDSHGRFEFNGAEYFIRRKLERQYVMATLSTHHRRVFVKNDGKLIKVIPFPFTGTVADPLC